MEWPQYTSMEHLLATEQGRFGALSIVARLSSPDLSPRRVNLASAGFGPSDGAGHAAIVHEFEGRTHVFFTSPEQPCKVRFTDQVPGEGQFVVRTRQLDEDSLAALNATMEHIVECEWRGRQFWTLLRPSAAFASICWERIFDEHLEHRAFGLSNPDNLARSILEVRHRELGLDREERPTLDLRLSQRTSDLMREQEVEEQRHSRGRSI
jgi:hypothetical protein